MDKHDPRDLARDMGKKTKKIDKLERISGLGQANRSEI
jgi:hypothetical protein